jgi:hypothetical protein
MKKLISTPVKKLSDAQMGQVKGGNTDSTDIEDKRNRPGVKKPS